jgi:hypothetical protein
MILRIKIIFINDAGGAASTARRRFGPPITRRPVYRFANVVVETPLRPTSCWIKWSP